MKQGSDRLSLPPRQGGWPALGFGPPGECRVSGPGRCWAWHVEEAKVQEGRSPLAPGSPAGGQGEVTSWLGEGKTSVQPFSPFLSWADGLSSEL